MLHSDLQTEFDALLPGNTTEYGATQRTALKAALHEGPAACAMPALVQTEIKTPAERLAEGEKIFDGHAWYARLVGTPSELAPKHAIDLGATRAWDFAVCPDAPHALRVDYCPSYRREAAADGFRCAFARFKAKGVA